MPSPVRYQTQAAIRQAKRHCSGRELGLTVHRRVKDIATDTLVEERFIGKEYGEDRHYDALLAAALMYGLFNLNKEVRVAKIMKKVGVHPALAIRANKTAITLGAGALLVGALGLIPGKIVY
tara:strand:- start:324 stop:689 length:366 start_codon:yes stop_codon:yes gene_type:complete